MAVVKLMTQAEYAKHRGCSAVAVHKAVKANRISLIGDKIDPKVADIQWQQNTRARAKQPGALVSDVAAAMPDLVSQAETADGDSPADPENDSAAPTGEPSVGDSKYMASRSSREQAEARMAWIKLAEQEGEVIRVAAVEAVWGAALAACREHLLQLRARLAPLLAAETDVFKVEQMLDKEMSTALAWLAKADPKKDAT